MIHWSNGGAPALAAAFSGIILAASPAFGFCRTTTCDGSQAPECVRVNGCWTAGAPLYWESSCTSFSVQLDASARLGLNHDALAPIAISAFARWPAAMCSDGFLSISVQDQGAVTCDRPEYNPSGPNANVVTFVDANWPHDPSAIALTTVSFGLKTGKILDADMEINSANFALDAQSLDYVFTHESGHFFGLDHSSDSDAIMYAYYTLPGPGAPVPALSADDAQAICTTYPPLRVAVECRFEPAKGFASDCGGDVTGGCSLAPAPRSTERRAGAGVSALALLALAFGVRRRRQGSDAHRKPQVESKRRGGATITSSPLPPPGSSAS